MNLELLESLKKLHTEIINHVVVTVLSSRGHAPSDPGAKAIFTEEGLFAGTIGGGKVEARCLSLAKELLHEKKKIDPFTKTWNLQTEIGMTCGGEVTLLFELSIPASWEIAVFGAGHVAQSLIQLLVNLDCRIHCIDPREEWISRLPSSPKLLPKITSQMADEVSKLTHCHYFLILTQGHATDLPILKAIYSLDRIPYYIGAIGSDTKAQRIKRDLIELGIPGISLENLRCPVGLTLGSNDPREIAISIAAQLLEARDQFPN